VAKHAVASTRQLTESDCSERESDDAAADYDVAVSDVAELPARQRRWVRVAVATATTVGVALGVLLGWQWQRGQTTAHAEEQREVFLQVSRQGAVNLTTIDWQHADQDVTRILNGATGQFRDDFAQRAGPFADLIKKSQSTTGGTVTAAGLESEAQDSAQALVAVVVKSSNAAAPQQESRSWRMRIAMQRDGGQVKIANVEFVP
jgi:Mce-associated membrane protein